MLILLGLVVVIIALLVGFGTSMFASAKEDVKVTMMNNDTIYEGDCIEVRLTDVNGTPITAELVKITITDENGVTDSHTIRTNEMGAGKLALNKSSGKYTVNFTFEGNENYTGKNISKKITIVPLDDKVSYESNSASGSSQTSSNNGIVSSREFTSYDYAPGLGVRENTYANGDVEHYYSDGSYDYYDSSSQEWKYRNPDGSSGSMYVGN